MTTLTANDTMGLKRELGESALPALACEARDLKRIMTHLADQIADTDRRHSEALAAMQQRLGQLGTTTHGLREQLPLEMTGVLDRIEGSMAQLSDRMSTTDQSRRVSQAAIPLSSVPAAAIAAAAAAVPAARPAPIVEAAPALRSALAAEAIDTYAKRAQSARPAAAEPVDTFDVVDRQVDPVEDEHWDRNAADDLARLYEAGVDLPSGVPALDAVSVATAMAEPVAEPMAVEPMAPEPAPEAQPASMQAFGADIAAEVAALQAKSLVGEREWLELRFAEVAQRLDHSLAGLKAGDPMEEIETRFTTLEQRLSEALVSAPTKTDLASLKSIETQVEDLNAQLVSVQTHFSRLDTIELELRSLAERLTGDGFAKLFEAGAPRGPDSDEIAGAVASRMAQQMPRIEETLATIATQLSAERIAGIVAQSRGAPPDATLIARMVADQVSQHLPHMPQHLAPIVDPSARLDELQSTLAAYVAERRHGDEQTNTMLDTMQQAMIRLLDRMETIEQSQYAVDDEDREAASDHGSASSSAYRSAEPEHRPEPSPVIERAQESRALVIAEPRRSEPEPTSDAYAFPPEPKSAPLAPPLPPGAMRANGAQGGQSEEQQQAAANANRDDFVAAARRAARMASEAPAETHETPEAAPPVAKRTKPAVQPGRRQLSTVSMALICLLLVGASFVAVKSTILAPKAPAPTTQPRAAAPEAAPARNSADRRLQNLEDADVLIEDDRARRSPDQGGNGGPRRSSADGLGGNDGQLPGGQGGFPGDFQRQRGDAPTFPAALTKDTPAGIAAPRSNDQLPLAIGPSSLRNAATKGDASAEFEIGARFAEGRGIQQDLQRAINWYQKAAAQGFAPAQYRLGSMYERGLGVKADLARARVWYQRAAEGGIVKAMHNLAVLSAGRDAAVTDYQIAGKWFRAAADHGLTDSQFNLAIMHDSGLGMERDAKQAFKWFSLAARSGDEEASRRRESLRQKLLPQEIAQIEAELANWRPKSADQAVNDPRLAGESWKSRAR